ncbi:MAG: YhbY family RNA-binding protein [Thermoplasmata archaeon]|nr:YhbY family RNA-binding protein [Thermoplasmata archaeon]
MGDGKSGKTEGGVWHIAATLRVGKNGVTEEFLAEVADQLEKRKTVKLKLPKGMQPVERQNMAEDIASRVGAVLVGVRGNSVVLAEKVRG